MEAGNFDSDAYDELAIGVPQEDVGGFCESGGICDAGGVHILQGSNEGITTEGGQYITQDDVGETAEGNEEKQFGDEFGKDFQVADFNGDGFEDLAISAWRETLNDGPGELPQAGIIHVVYGSDSGLNLAGSQVWHQDVSGVQDRAESFDQFGWFG